MKKKLFIPLLSGIFFISLIPLIIFATYSRAVGDDFVYSASLFRLIKSNNWNIFSLLGEAANVSKGFYNTWQGTYASAFIMSLQPGIFKEELYCIGAFLLMLLCFLSILFAVKTIKKIYCPTLKYDWLISFGTAATLLLGMPDIGEGLYYYDSAWHYTAFCFFALINATLALKLVYEENKKRQVIYIILSVVLSLIAAGGNQMPGFLNILVLLLFFLFLGIKRAKYVVFPLVASITGFILTLVAPGTAVRQEAEAALEGPDFVKPGVIKTVVKCTLKYFRLLSEWINISWLAFLILLIPVAVMFVYCIKTRLRLHPAFLIIIFSIIQIGMLCVPFYGMGHDDPFGEGRLLDAVWIAFMLFSAVAFIYTFVWIFYNKDISLFSKLFNRKDVQLILLLCALIIGFFPNTNGYLTINEMRFGYAKAYTYTYNMRLNMIKNHHGNGPVKVPPMDDSSEILEDGDWISPWGLFYGADVVLLEDNETIEP